MQPKSEENSCFHKEKHTFDPSYAPLREVILAFAFMRISRTPRVFGIAKRVFLEEYAHRCSVSRGARVFSMTKRVEFEKYAHANWQSVVFLESRAFVL